MGLTALLDEKGAMKPEACNPTWEEVAENQKQTRLLEQKLNVKRSWVSRFADRVRDMSWYDIWMNKGKIIGLATAATVAVYLFGGYGENRRRTHLAEMAESRPGIQASFEPVSIADYEDEIRDAASGGTPSDVIEALLHAAQQNPGYVKAARAAGKVGIIPLDPYLAGIRPELLESDDELCIRAAAELYSRIRQEVATDIQALAIFFSSHEDYEEAMAEARRLEVDAYSSNFDRLRYHGEQLENHKMTLELIEKHNRGELTGQDYWWACTKGASHRRPYGEWDDDYWKEVFERAISGEDTHYFSQEELYVLESRTCPSIHILTEEGYETSRAFVDGIEDFTTHLPLSARRAVRTARDYLNSDK